MYFIITINFDRESRRIERERTVGFYDNVDLANTTILNNTCDIFEDGYYRYAAILYIEQGLYPDSEVIQWYEYDTDTGEVRKCAAPKCKNKYYLYVVG